MGFEFEQVLFAKKAKGDVSGNIYVTEECLHVFDLQTRFSGFHSIPWNLSCSEEPLPRSSTAV